MECFEHSGSNSVGVCKACGKAVCRTCVVDAGVAIACSDRCAKEAADVHEMNQRGKKLYGIGTDRKNLPSGVVMWLLLGALFSGYGIYASLRSREPEWFLLLFGAVSFFIAWLAYYRAKDVGIQC
ncbi:hypothetical protein [Duganella sp. Root336D2]|uniref:hypothetical protein n=1 Tax=Duganella sp. Root336D2 TaxID=1736518 RepID=UPI000B14BCF7|nr:hypothetical protein [Duganella sp. Root336D2]